ncbi:MAG: hypothetical protein ACT4P6_22135 [Gemmatimonadaceae bacterium]
MWTAGRPASITCDHGSEFTSTTLEAWPYVRGVQLDFTRPGKPRTTGTSSHPTAGCGMSA